MRRRRSRLSDQQTHVLLEEFVAGTPARQAAALASVHRNTAILFYLKLRELIAQRMSQSGPFRGTIALDSLEVDDAHRDELRRVARGTAPLVGLLEYNHTVQCVLLARGSSAPPARRMRLRLEAIIEPGVLRLAPVLDGRGRAAGSARGRPSGDVVDEFIRDARQHLRRFNGLPRKHLDLFLKECAWRFSYGPPQHLLQTLMRWFEQGAQNEAPR